MTAQAPSVATERCQSTLTVSELNQNVRLLLENGMGRVEVSGEIANLATPQSGHLYFKLRDQQAQVQCAFFRAQARSLAVTLDNGMAVTVTASVSLYEVRGDYQLIVQRCRLSGDGALQQQFEQLKRTLAQAGLFDPARKKPLPRWPKAIGLITSDSGAALHDMLTTLKQRMPAIPIWLYATPVQGSEAAASIARQLSRANQDPCCDVLIVARGGGSLEDLWPFNTPEVAHAIAQSDIPVISGVGHEPDVTIADLCADQRAATPTAAAVLASPDQRELLLLLSQMPARLHRAILQQWQQQQQRLQQLLRWLSTPERQVQQRMIHLDRLHQRLNLAIKAILKQHQHQCHGLLQRLWRQQPHVRLQRMQQHISHCHHRLTQQMMKMTASYRQRFERLATTLQATSPLATLQRGYGLVQDQQGQVITNSKQVNVDDKLNLTLHHGKLECVVTEKSS